MKQLIGWRVAGGTNRTFSEFITPGVTLSKQTCILQFLTGGSTLGEKLRNINLRNLGGTLSCQIYGLSYVKLNESG